MTCEIAIMNREAVALAADSAVTISGDKIFNTANKLFALSDNQPIGVMIFGSDNFMSVPWETIITLFRKHLGTKALPKLSDYGAAFINFLKSNTMKVPKDLEVQHMKNSILIYLSDIQKKIIEARNQAFYSAGQISDKQVAEIVTKVIDDYLKQFAQAPVFAWANSAYRKKVEEEYSKVLQEMIPSILEKLPLSTDNLKQIEDGFFQTVCKEWWWNVFRSGIVIAGFGKEELFPSVMEYHVESLICGELKFILPQECKVQQANNGNTAWIIPFAQADEAQTFIRGINPIFSQDIQNFVGQAASELIAAFQEASGKDDLKVKLQEAATPIMDKFKQSIQQYSQTVYIDPLMNTVAVLPRSELAAMAESLVNLSSFKKHVTQDKETVGGPIDVAVISKIDGFVWIKKKKYFDENINQHLKNKDQGS
jgi:hypothetical protein